MAPHHHLPSPCQPRPPWRCQFRRQNFKTDSPRSSPPTIKFLFLGSAPSSELISRSQLPLLCSHRRRPPPPPRYSRHSHRARCRIPCSSCSEIRVLGSCCLQAHPFSCPMASAEALRENNPSEGPAGCAQEVDGGEEVNEREATAEMAGEGEPEEKEAAGGEGKEGGGKRKRGRKPGKPKNEAAEKKIGKKRQAREAKPSPGRPTRERRTVERFSEMSPRRAVVTKAVSIQKGSGAQLKDIPNVFFKLSKRKVDENLQLLHRILFAKKAKALYVKRNIYQFSGFVWSENEEKQRAKVKEKLDKCVKDKLLDFCDVLDIPVSRAVAKKEDISAKLLEFLESPCVTRDVVLAVKEQKERKRKRRSKGTGGGYSESDRETKKQKEGETSKNGRKRSVEKVEDDDGGDASDDDDQDEVDKMEEKHDEDSESEGEEDEQDEPTADKEDPAQKRTKGTKSKANLKTSALRKGSPAKSTRMASRSPSKKSSIEVRGNAPGKSREGSSMEQIKTGPKTSTKQKGETVKSKRDSRSESNDSLKEKENKKSQSGPKASAKEHGKEKSSGKDKEPTREEVHAVVWAILKEVDFNTATLADILKQLGSHFGRDLMHRKAEVKSIIEEVINDMTDDEEDESEEDNEEA